MKQKKENGFTMLELIMVIAVIGILGAMVIPAYNVMSTKARLSTDIATVKTLKRTADSYKAEMGVYPKATNLAELNKVLVESQYLENNAVLQTVDSGTDLFIVNEDATHAYEIRLDLSKCTDSSIDKALKQMRSDVNRWIHGKEAGKGKDK